MDKKPLSVSAGSLIDHPFLHRLYQTCPDKVQRILTWVKYHFLAAVSQRMRNRHMIRTIKRSGLFYTSYYKRKYPQVAAETRDPVKHYVERGADCGYNPNPLFDTKYYITTYPDVTVQGQNPLYHYIRFGAAEGRNPSPRFSTRAYLSYYSDVEKAGMNPLFHYLYHGVLEDRCVQ